MKHKNKCKTCDRCGAEIKNTLIRKGRMNIKTEVQERFCEVYEE